MFLTDEALAQLTGLQRQSAMCRWLEREGIPFVVAADGNMLTLGMFVAIYFACRRIL